MPYDYSYSDRPKEFELRPYPTYDYDDRDRAYRLRLQRGRELLEQKARLVAEKQDVNKQAADKQAVEKQASLNAEKNRIEALVDMACDAVRDSLRVEITKTINEKVEEFKTRLTSKPTTDSVGAPFSTNGPGGSH